MGAPVRVGGVVRRGAEGVVCGRWSGRAALERDLQNSPLAAETADSRKFGTVFCWTCKIGRWGRLAIFRILQVPLQSRAGSPGPAGGRWSARAAVDGRPTLPTAAGLTILWQALSSPPASASKCNRGCDLRDGSSRNHGSAGGDVVRSAR